MDLKEFIHDRGRGPEIKGTRITVYSILDFMLSGWHCERIADLFKLHPQQVQAAMDYVRENTLPVLREYVKILERSERGNPPEVQAQLDASHEKFQELVQRIREAKARGQTDVSDMIARYRETLMQEAGHARDHGG